MIKEIELMFEKPSGSISFTADFLKDESTFSISGYFSWMYVNIKQKILIRINCNPCDRKLNFLNIKIKKICL